MHSVLVYAFIPCPCSQSFHLLVVSGPHGQSLRVGLRHQCGGGVGAQPGVYFYKDERTDKNKILIVEYMATSDTKRRMPLGFWLLVGVLHTVSSFSFVESVSCLCCARGGAVGH